MGKLSVSVLKSTDFTVADEDLHCRAFVSEMGVNKEQDSMLENWPLSKE